MANDNHQDGEHHGVGHVVPVSLLVQVLVALLFLTGVTVWSAGYDLGWANIYLAMLIASVKAFLVVAFFMHLRWDKPFNQIVFVGTLIFVALFLVFSLMDTRAYRHQQRTGDAPFVGTSYEEGKLQAESQGGSGH
ncbi:MAG: cytochrome C oxidase subunit IV family protein [Planctomycetota bacterium]